MPSSAFRCCRACFSSAGSFCEFHSGGNDTNTLLTPYDAIRAALCIRLSKQTLTALESGGADYWLHSLPALALASFISLVTGAVYIAVGALYAIPEGSFSGSNRDLGEEGQWLSPRNRAQAQTTSLPTPPGPLKLRFFGELL